MPEEYTHTQIEGVEWQNIIPFLKIFGSFKMAIQPAKMGLALLLVILLYLGGQAMDFIWGPQVKQSEVVQYFNQSKVAINLKFNTAPTIFDHTKANAENSTTNLKGIFETTKNLEIGAFNQLINSAASFNLGVTNFLTDSNPKSSGAIGALKTMVIIVPAWLYYDHPSFLAVYLLLSFLLLALIGGAISRLAAVQAGADRQTNAPAALHFTSKRYLWFVITPLLPLIIAFIVGVILSCLGAIFFNFPVGDVIGAALFGFMLIGGLIITVLLIATVVGVNLFYPALAVEASDSFDVISRVFNYTLGRPWRYLFYTAVMIIYGAITYLFVGLVIFLILAITRAFVGWWNVNLLQAGVTRFDAILPAPEFGKIMEPTNWSLLKTDSSASISALIVLVWVKLLIALLPAYAVSYYFSAHTWIYLLLRKSADKTEYQQVYLESNNEANSAKQAPEKID